MPDQDEQVHTGESQPRAVIECPCGFRVESDEMALNADVFADHECPEEPEQWYHAAFSIWTVLIALALTFGIAAIFEAVSS